MAHSKDFKKSIISALDRYSAKQARKDSPKPKKAKNNKPEKEVEKQVMHWLKDNGFSCHVIESKATYNPKAGAYVSAPVIAGMPDVIGCTPDGTACFIELKAPGRLNTLKPHQRAFLLTKLDYGCFAVCVDSVELLQKLHSEWLQGADMFRHLPKERARPVTDSDDLDF